MATGVAADSRCCSHVVAVLNTAVVLDAAVVVVVVVVTGEMGGSVLPGTIGASGMGHVTGTKVS